MIGCQSVLSMSVVTPANRVVDERVLQLSLHSQNRSNSFLGLFLIFVF